MPKFFPRHHGGAFRFALAVLLAAFVLGGVRAAAGQKPAEAELAKRVRQTLVNEPFYTLFDHLTYKVDGAHVTLGGQVVRDTLKIDAVRDVRGLPGVESVTDTIEVLPASKMDSRLRRAEFHAIYSAPGMEKYAIRAVPPIHIIVKNGHVTLYGAVLDQGDKNLVNARANTVKGAFSVTNKLMVEKKR